MDSTTELMRFLGSPFVDVTSPAPADKARGYILAANNKVALWYLDKLKNIDECSSFVREYNEGINRYTETSLTAVRLCSAIEKHTSRFAVFKFLKPFPHTPSDVDVLFFVDGEEFRSITNHLTETEYFKVAESPSQTVLYDLRGGTERMDTRSVGGKSGGRYYIDLYSDVSASHVVYISNETLTRHRITADTARGQITTLDPVADLCVVLSHSIIPERMLTMADCYTALHYIKQMTNSMIEELGTLFIENRMTLACWHSMNAVASIHKQVFGFVPDKVNTLIDAVNIDPRKPSEVGSATPQLPYRYSNRVLIEVLVERMKNQKGFRSMVNQAMRSTHPRMASWVLSNWVQRSKRETY